MVRACFMHNFCVCMLCKTTYVDVLQLCSVTVFHFVQYLCCPSKGQNTLGT